MKSYRLKIKSIIVFTSILSIFIFSILVCIIYPAEFKRLGEILLHYGYIILPSTLLWVLIEEYCWQLKWFQKLFRTALNIPPDIRGRWEGTLIRDGENREYTFYIEIYQTLTKLQVYTFSNAGNSKSVSQFAFLTSDDMENKFTLCYLWRGDATSITNLEIPPSIFTGFSKLELNENVEPKELVGAYFTDRKPKQTKGNISLKWVNLNRKGKA